MQHLDGKFEQNQRFSIKIIRVCARLFTGFLPDNWWHRRLPQTANKPRPDRSAFRPLAVVDGIEHIDDIKADLDQALATV